MNDIRKLSRVACLLLCLAACGGGEDGNEGKANPVASSPSPGRTPSTQSASTGALPKSNTPIPGGQITEPGTGAETSTDAGSLASTTVVVSGLARAEVPPENLKTGAPLNYKAMSYQNIRGETVELLDATSNAVPAHGTTDANGFYSMRGSVNTRVLVRVKAQSRSTWSNSGRYNISVNANPNGYALYELDSTTFDTGNVATIALNLSANSGRSGTAYTDVRASPAFAILDTVYKSLQKLTQMSSNIEMPDVKLMWSVNNTTPRGDKALGQIGTSHYSGFDARKEVNAFAKYILGKADVDTDEFDESVVAHEYGHYLQVTQFRDDSPGGSHGGGDRLDMRLAFSDSGNAWSGIATVRRIYTDSSGPGQSEGFPFDLSTGDTYGSKGRFYEASIQYILTVINQVAGFKPIWNALTSEQFRYGAPVTAIHSFLAALDSVTRGNATVQAALLGEGIVSNDAWGTGELNGGGLIGEKSVLPIYKSYLMRGLASQYHLSSDCSTPNKWGNTQFVRLTIPESKACAIAVSGAGPSRPNMLIFQNGRPIYFPDSVLMNGAVVGQLGQGDMTLSLSDAQLRSLGTSCLNLTIN